MKKTVLLKITTVLLFVSLLASCKKDEPSTPSNNNTPNPVNNKPTLIADKWITQKVYIDGAEQANHFLIGSIYQFWDNDSYSFLIPGVGSASGTWAFNNTEQNQLKLMASGTTTIWTLKTLTATDLVSEFKDSNGKTWKYEFKHP